MTRFALPLVLVACATTESPDPVDTDTGPEAVPDTASLADSDSDPAVDTGDSTPLPFVPTREPCLANAPADLSGWCDVGVNNADAIIPTEPGDPLRLELLGRMPAPGPAPGGFNGNGIGNRALAGTLQVGGDRLADAGELTIESQRVAAGPTLFPELLLHVDLACDGASRAWLTTSLEDWRPALDGRNWTTQRLTSDRGVWYALTQVPDPREDADRDLLDRRSAPNARPNTLDAVIEAYPDACLVNTSTPARSLPPGTLPGLMISMGGDVQASATATWQVRRVVFGTHDWGSPEAPE